MKKITLVLIFLLFAGNAMAQNAINLIPKKPLPKSRLELARRTQAGSFYDVVGRRAAAFGYEHRSMEAWVYPLKIVDDFALEFQIEGYNLAFRGADLLTNIEVRPEATVFTYSHAAFTVRQIVYAPIDEPGLISLLDVTTTLPMTIGVSFRPKLRLTWPAGSMTPFVGQDEQEKYYYIGEETQKFYGIVGSPGARDASLMPYQEEPRDVPVKYTLAISPAEAAKNFVPVVIAASTDGLDKALAAYRKLLVDAVPLYEKNVRYYEALLDRTTGVTTPDERLNTAFAWARVGIDKGVATNPFLGTGLLAGFRTSGESERPGFAWYFGRDALWTAFATTAAGDFATTRAALDFLRRFQREDGKIPHEISQSAAQTDWWKAYPYPWNAADATPLYVIGAADYFRASGDLEFLKAHWESIKKAYRFTAATDTDGNGLVENTKFGHGWVEGGSLYPPHEEIYLQGVWVEAARGLAELAEALGERQLADEARAAAEKTRAATEKTFWLENRGFYAYATQIPPAEPVRADQGPNRARRQKRLNALQKAKIYDEETVLPAVPLWWKTLTDDRAQRQLDRLGSARIATDWGARILANDSELYDPLSYHAGSVWPLFTGWQSVAAYNYGRPQIGFQALTANSRLTYTNALGYVTELLSGDFNAPFGRSSHHQIWSEAMVVTPLLRGTLGLETASAGRTLKFAPQIPVNWNDLEIKSVRAGDSVFDFKLRRAGGRMTIAVSRKSGTVADLVLAPAFPLDAVVRNVTIDGQKTAFRIKAQGDVQRAETILNLKAAQTEIGFDFVEGSDVYLVAPPLVAGAESGGLRIIKSEARKTGLFLVLEGRGGRNYELFLKSPRNFGETDGVRILTGNERILRISFAGTADAYVRREISLPFRN